MNKANIDRLAYVTRLQHAHADCECRFPPWVDFFQIQIMPVWASLYLTIGVPADTHNGPMGVTVWATFTMQSRFACCEFVDGLGGFAE